MLLFPTTPTLKKQMKKGNVASQVLLVRQAGGSWSEYVAALNNQSPTSTNINTNTCILTNTNTFILTNTNTCILTNTNTCMLTNTNTCMLTNTNTCILTNTNTCILTNTNTDKNKKEKQYTLYLSDKQEDLGQNIWRHSTTNKHKYEYTHTKKNTDKNKKETFSCLTSKRVILRIWFYLNSRL